MDPIDEALASAQSKIDASLAQYDEEMVVALFNMTGAIEQFYRLQRERGLSQEIVAGGIGGAVGTCMRRLILDDTD